MGALPSLASAASIPASDIAILNFALTLEYLEAAFYRPSRRRKLQRARPTRSRSIVAAHEAAHVAFLKGALGRKAVKKPTFDFKGTTTDQTKFQATAQVLEDTGVLAYLGQVGNIKSKKILAAAGSILPVEARHAALDPGHPPRKGAAPLPAPAAFQGAKTKAQILAAVKAHRLHRRLSPRVACQAPLRAASGTHPTERN